MSKHAVEAGEVDPRFGDQCGQAGDEVQGLQYDVGGEINYLESIAPEVEWEIKTTPLRQIRPQQFPPSPPRSF